MIKCGPIWISSLALFHEIFLFYFEILNKSNKPISDERQEIKYIACTIHCTAAIWKRFKA